MGMKLHLSMSADEVISVAMRQLKAEGHSSDALGPISAVEVIIAPTPRVSVRVEGVSKDLAYDTGNIVLTG